MFKVSSWVVPKPMASAIRMWAMSAGLAPNIRVAAASTATMSVPAISAFKSIEGYSDSAEKIKECTYNSAVDLQDKGKYTEAKIIFETLEGYKDCSTRIQTCIYGEATAELKKGNFDKAAELCLMARAKHPGAKIIFSPADRIDEAKEMVKNKLGGENNGFYTVVLPMDCGGKLGHPSVTGHNMAKDILVKFINEMRG